MNAAINEIDWSRLIDAYGAATEVPVWLHQLSSPKPAERSEAIEALFGLISHQGTIYSSSIAALPVLAQFITDKNQDDRDMIAGLIASIVTGSCWYHASSMWPECVRSSQEKMLSDQGTTIEEQMEIEKPIIEAARSFGASKLGQLIPFLTSTDSEIRQQIAKATTMFPNAAKDQQEVIRQALECETEDWVREALTEAVAAVATTVENRE